MKKILLISLLIIGCKKEVVTTKTSEPVKDCSCDRVVKISKFNTVGETNMVTCYIWTVNDCTNLTKHVTRYFIKGTEPNMNECYKMPY